MKQENRCRKCQGRLLLDKDEFGWYEECIQCGHIQDVSSLGKPELVPVFIQKADSSNRSRNPEKVDFFY